MDADRPRVPDGELLEQCAFIHRAYRNRAGERLSLMERFALDLLDARSALYCPGHWRCPKCGFHEVRKIINSDLGVIGSDADTSRSVCPNDGTDMVPVPWKEVAESSSDAAADARTALAAARRERDEARADAERWGSVAINGDGWPYEWEIATKLRAKLAAVEAERDANAKMMKRNADDWYALAKEKRDVLLPRAEQAEAENARLRAALTEAIEYAEDMAESVGTDHRIQSWRSALSTSREPSPPLQETKLRRRSLHDEIGFLLDSTVDLPADKYDRDMLIMRIEAFLSREPSPPETAK